MSGPMTEYLLVAVLGLVALGAVAFPVLVGRERYLDRADFEADLQRYRDALRAGTVCGHCREPNPAGSRFCGQCGRPLD